MQCVHLKLKQISTDVGNGSLCYIACDHGAHPKLKIGPEVCHYLLNIINVKSQMQVLPRDSI